MKINVYLVLICVSFLLPLTVSASDKTVYITDDSNDRAECGTLNNLIIGALAVDFEVSGEIANCLAGGGVHYSVSVPNPLQLDPVSEGLETSKDASPGVIAKLPITVTVSPVPPAETREGGRVWVTDGTVIHYEAPSPGTIPGSSVTDTFSYTVTDAGDKSDTGVVEVVVNESLVVPLPSVGSCVDESGVIDCEGDVDITHLGTTQHRKASVKGTDVWTITGRSVEGGLEFRYLTNEMTVSLTQDYRYNSKDANCTKALISSTISYSDEGYGGFYDCKLEPGIQYYLRISSAQLGSYEFHY